VSPGFEKPSAIQSKGIVPFTKGFDVIQQAQSGTGKTATFCAGILNNLSYDLLECQARFTQRSQRLQRLRSDEPE
jgi:translation initiation factor 4A